MKECEIEPLLSRLRVRISQPFTGMYDVVAAASDFFSEAINHTYYRGIWPGPNSESDEEIAAWDELHLRVLWNDASGDEYLDSKPVPLSEWLVGCHFGDIEEAREDIAMLEKSLAKLKAKLEPKDP